MLAILVFVFWFFLGYQRFFDPSSRSMLSPYTLGEIGVFGFSLLLSVMVISSITVTLNTLLLRGLKPTIQHDNQRQHGAGEPKKGQSFAPVGGA